MSETHSLSTLCIAIIAGARHRTVAIQGLKRYEQMTNTTASSQRQAVSVAGCLQHVLRKAKTLGAFTAEKFRRRHVQGFLPPKGLDEKS